MTTEKDRPLLSTEVSSLETEVDAQASARCDTEDSERLLGSRETEIQMVRRTAAGRVQPEAATDERLTIGQTLGGRYRIERKLGEGGMGVVYLASDEQVVGETFAIKVLKEALHREALTLLREEVHKTRRLSHPNIVDVHSVNVDGTKLYVLMEYLEGKPLSALLDEEFGRGMPLSRAWPIIEDVGAALSHAHDHSVIHSDMKPANVLLTTSGRAKLLDFGIARVSRGPLLHERLGPLALTPAYASCEMLRGEEADRRDDIYSFACVIYEMLSGERPFGELNALEAREAGSQVSPLQMLTRGQNAALAKALAFDREERTSSVEKLLEACAAPTPAASVAHDSVVVLPFINIGADAENEYFADGITEEIINALAQIKELHVVARSSAFSFKGKYIDARIVGEQLNVRTVLEGSVRRVDDQVRITAQLVNAADGYHLWSERYDREMKDIFTIQDEIAYAIVRRLQVAFEEGGQEPLVRVRTQNLEAYQLYLKGRALLYQRGSAILRSLECCQQAATLDPEYALAWAGLADCYTTLGYQGLARPEGSMPKAMEAARRAVALDPKLAEAHNALAMASLMGAWDRAEAEREFLRAIELNPKYIQAHDWYALFYLQWSEGRLAEGRTQAKLALDYDPLSSYANAIYGLTCATAGSFLEALDVARRAVELDPESYLARVILQFALHANGLFEESVATGELALAISGRHFWAMVFLATTLAEWREPKDADAIYDELRARARRQYVPPGALAVVASAAAREDDAVRHTREAFEIRDPNSQFLASRYFPMSGRLYEYPRFRQIIAQYGRGDWLTG